MEEWCVMKAYTRFQKKTWAARPSISEKSVHKALGTKLKVQRDCGKLEISRLWSICQGMMWAASKTAQE